jgi:oxygen-independent coproporphyrinogen-3 oxidase
MSVSAETLQNYAVLPVPRYTSYPTAAEFSDGIGAVEHARWLGRIETGQPVSIYLHVPYCRELCHYCGCHAKAYRRDSVISAYQQALEAEILLIAARIRGRLKAARIHWGGGTPTSLGADGLASVIDVLGHHFDIVDNIKHAIELDPRNVDAAMARDLKLLGINRVSLGVQDVDPLVQAAIGRIQPFEVVEAAVGHLRDAGIDRINFDLIYGLPLQTVKSLTRSAKAVAQLGPERIACYGYAHMPSRRANQRLIDAQDLPNAARRIELARAVADVLLANGYEAVGIDHFARSTDKLLQAANEGNLHRNFQGYTDDDNDVLIGFGASAISKLPDGYAQNIADNPRYCTAIAEGRLPTVRGLALTHADRVRASIISDLLCGFRADVRSIAASEDFTEEMALLRPMIRDGIVTIRDGVIEMTAAGRPVVRVVAAVFDQYRRQLTGTFSPAI